MSTFITKRYGSSYPEHPLDPPAKDGGKRTRYYKRKFREAYGIGFNKGRVGAAIKRLLLEGKGDGATLERLGKLTRVIWEALRTQLGRAGSG